MPQPAAIIEWWGSYETLEEVRIANDWTGYGENVHVFCMALGREVTGEDASRCRFLISWQQPGSDDQAHFPVDVRLSDVGNECFYLGWIASYNPGANRQSAEWALVRALRPELNGPPNPHPPGWKGQYCGSVCSWFYSTDGTRKIEPPFPTVITFNDPDYDDPPDEERVLRLPLG